MNEPSTTEAKKSNSPPSKLCPKHGEILIEVVVKSVIHANHRDHVYSKVKTDSGGIRFAITYVHVQTDDLTGRTIPLLACPRWLTKNRDETCYYARCPKGHGWMGGALSHLSGGYPILLCNRWDRCTFACIHPLSVEVTSVNKRK